MAESDNSDKNDGAVEITEATLNIHQRIHIIMGEVGPLLPDKMHPVFKDKKKVGEFPYNSHDGVTAHIKAKFLEHGVLPLSTVVDHRLNGNRTELTVDTSFINIEDPSDKVTVRTIGYGADHTDKGPGKALSYAVKSAFLKVLMLNSQEDTGEDAVEHDPSDTRTSEVDEAKDKARKAFESAATTYQAAIHGATSKKELQDLKRKNVEWLVDAPDVTRIHFEKMHNDRMQAIEPPA